MSHAAVRWSRQEVVRRCNQQDCAWRLRPRTSRLSLKPGRLIVPASFSSSVAPGLLLDVPQLSEQHSLVFNQYAQVSSSLLRLPPLRLRTDIDRTCRSHERSTPPPPPPRPSFPSGAAAHVMVALNQSAGRRSTVSNEPSNACRSTENSQTCAGCGIWHVSRAWSRSSQPARCWPSPAPDPRTTSCATLAHVRITVC